MRHERALVRRAARILGDREGALDVVQETFLRALGGLSAFRSDCAPSSWLHRIASNVAIDRLRRAGAEPLVAVDDLEGDWESAVDWAASRSPPRDPFDDLFRAELARRIADALARLPLHHRGVVLMHEVDGMTCPEIAAVLGVSEGTIMSRLFYARRKLRAALVDAHGELAVACA